MNRLLSGSLALVLVLPALVYDSNLIRNTVVPYPVFFFSFGLVALAILLLLLRGRVGNTGTIRGYAFILYAITMHGLAVSFFRGPKMGRIR